MSEDWAGIAAEVDEALGEVGTVATIKRPGGLDESTYPPTVGAPEVLTFRVVIDTYSAQDRAGTNIGQTDVKLIMSGLTAAPCEGDKVQVSDQTYSVIAIKAERPAGESVLYEVQASVS